MPSDQMRQFFDNMANQGLMLTYDDVRLRTLNSDILPPQTDISSRLTRNIRLHMPIISSPMDTVTTGPMAIAMAEAGGAGTIYRMKDVHEQARHVRRAKFSLNGLIQTPITVQHDEIIADILKMREAKGYTFETFPVLDGEGKVIGLVSGSDFDFCENHSGQVTSIMTHIDQLVSENKNTTKEDAYHRMRTHKKKVLMLIDDEQHLAGMYIYSDLKRIFGNGGAMYNVDKNGQLIVGAAVGAGPAAIDRAGALAEKNVDYFQIDTAHGDSANVLWTIRELKRLFPNIDVLAGNVSSGPSAVALAKAGADGILVGQGPGSICTTRVIAGVGVPQVSAVYECVRALALAGFDIPVCADGGINNSGDIVLALAVGASSVMLGRLLAGTEESPGETRLYNGVQVKDYRGMGSFGAMRDNSGSRERYGQASVSLNKVVPEGIEGIVPYRGPVAGVLTHYAGGLRSGLGYNGAATIKDLQERAEIFRITNAGLNESHPHDITITAEAPNYHRQ